MCHLCLCMQIKKPPAMALPGMLPIYIYTSQEEFEKRVMLMKPYNYCQSR